MMLPKPYIQIKGRKLLIYRSEEDEKISNIIVLDEASKEKYAPTVGTVIQVGDGYHPSVMEAQEMKEWLEACPYREGDKVVWSKYDDIVIRLRVHPEWWKDKTDVIGDKDLNGNVTQKEVPALEAMKALKKEFKVPFFLVEAHQLWGKVTAPEKEIWED